MPPTIPLLHQDRDTLPRSLAPWFGGHLPRALMLRQTLARSLFRQTIPLLLIGRALAKLEKAPVGLVNHSFYNETGGIAPKWVVSNLDADRLAAGRPPRHSCKHVVSALGSCRCPRTTPPTHPTPSKTKNTTLISSPRFSTIHPRLRLVFCERSRGRLALTRWTRMASPFARILSTTIQRMAR